MTKSIEAGSHFGNSTPIGGMGKTSILKDVNVRSSASSGASLFGQVDPERAAFEAAFPLDRQIRYHEEWKLYIAYEHTEEAQALALQQRARFDAWKARGALPAPVASQDDANPSSGLFKVVHGPLGTDGLPVHVRLESLGEWDIENLPAGMILSADARLPKGSELDERAAFEREFPPHEYVAYSEKYSCYMSTRSDAHFDTEAERHTARWEVWQSRTATAKRQSAREEGSWKILHGAMQLQRNHHRNVADMLRLSLSQLNSLMIESVGMVRGVVGNCDDELADRIDAALVTSASVLKSSDAAAAMTRVGVVLPEFAGQPENTVKRYEFDRFGDKKLSDTGQYVLATDFDKLAAQVIVQGKVPPADAILYHGQPGNVALLFPDQPAPSGFGWSVVRKWELRRSAYSFEAMTARLSVLEGLLAQANEIIEHNNSRIVRGMPCEKTEKFIQDYRAAQLPVDGVSLHD